MDEGWSLKALHRRIMLSSTYQQSSADRSDARSVDPENTLYWRMNRRRLDFEATARCASLSSPAGSTRRSAARRSRASPIPQPRRRTLYAFDRPAGPAGLYRTFDFPDPNATSPRRDQTTVPPQALFLMNHPFVRAAAAALANRPGRRGLERLSMPGSIACSSSSTAGRPAPRRSSLARSFLDRPARPLGALLPGPAHGQRVCVRGLMRTRRTDRASEPVSSEL